LDVLEVGGYKLTRPVKNFFDNKSKNGFDMVYDAAAESFTFTANTSSRTLNDASSKPLQNERNRSAIFLAGDSTKPNAVNLVVTGGALTLTKGVLDSASALTLRHVEINRRTTINGKQSASMQLIRASGSGLKAAFRTQSVLNVDKSVRIPGNTFVIYGQSQGVLKVDGFEVTGTADFGSDTAGQFQIANSQFVGLSASITEFSIGGLKFKPEVVGSSAAMTVSYAVPVGNESAAWNLTGGASLVSGSPTLPAGMKVAFGGGSTPGIQVFASEKRLTGSGAVVGNFTAGTSSLLSNPGVDGVRIKYNPASKKLELSGKATLNVNGFEAALDEYTKLLPGNDLTAWQFIESPNGRFVARVESSAGTTLQFLVRDKANNFAEVWKAGGSGNYVSMQTDGNLVRKGFRDDGISNTSGNPGAFLAIHNDGNLSVIHPDGRILWQTNVHIRSAPGSTAPPGVRVSFVPPTGVTAFSQNRADSDVVNMYIDERVVMNGLGLTPFGSPNALRIEARRGSSTFTGDLSTLIAGRNFFATANPINFGTGAVPSAGLTLDFTKIPNASTDWAVGGILMSGLRTATFTENNTKLTMNFPKSVFEKLTMADGDKGSEPNRIILTKGKITSAEINSPKSVKVGDFEFTNYKAVYNFAATPAAWVFSGPAKFFGKSVNVGGGPKEPNLKIGGDPKNPKRGPQILPSNLPYDVGPLSLPLPSVVVINGLNFDTSKFTQDSVETEGEPGQPPKSRTYKISTKEYTVKLGQTSLTFSGNLQFKVFRDPDDENKATYSILAFNAVIRQNSPITIGNASLQVESLELVYDVKDKQLEISGTAKFQYQASGASADISVSLGNKDNPGLVIRDGAVQSLMMTVRGEFNILKLNIKSEGLTLEYQKEDQQFVMYGSITLNTANQGGTQFIRNMKVKLGSSADKPGIVIASGSLKSIDISLSGDINLFGITATPERLRVRYSSDTSLLQITGGVSVTLANGLVLRAAFPGSGLIINTQTGDVEIRGVRLAAEGDIRFGVLSIKNLEAYFEDDGRGNVSFSAAATIALPSGLEVGGSFKVINGRLDSIGIKFQKNPGIQVAGGVINIYSIEGKLEGLSDLDNFRISATVRATVGPKVAFAGNSFALADVTGTIAVTKDNLTLSGDVQLVGGLFGRGSFTGVLTWSGTPRVQFDADVRLYPGDVIRGRISAYIDVNGNVDFDASIGVHVPNQIPVAGGWSLGQIAITLRVRPDEPPANSFVRFGVRILNASGAIKASFDANVRYDLKIDFFFFSIGKSGDFQLRDSNNRPNVQIVSANSIAGTPDGRIVFKSLDGETSGQIVDLYADTDAVGNDGVLIGSQLIVGSTDTTYVWRDMSTFAKPGQPVYVYAVVRDQQEQQTYSDYSLPFTVATGFLPAITAPATVGVEPGRVTTFEAAKGNAIVIDDPRKRFYADSEVLVALDSGAGTLDLPSVPSNVVVTGAGTRHMTLRGRQDDINTTLNGLTYASSESAIFDDTLTVSVDSLPLENLGQTVRRKIDLNLNPVTLATSAHQDSDIVSSSTVVTGDTGATPLELIDIDSRTSDFLTGARVQIANYESGSDVLDFSFNSELESGIDAAFDCETGVLILSGFESIETYESALQNVVFSTGSSAGNRSLIVSVLDENGERGEMKIPLTIVPGHSPPEVVFQDTGIQYTRDQDAVYVAPSVDLIVHDERQVTRVEVAFTNDSFVYGEDVLAYVNAGGPINARFDTAVGVLTLTGNGTAAEYAAALRAVFYESTGAGFSTGTRYVTISVFDSDFEQNTGSALQVIQKLERSEVLNSPVLTLSKELLELQPSDDYVVIDDKLKLRTDLPKLTEAHVSISEGHIPGEQTLAAGVLMDGMEASFDEQSGELIIRGVATAEAYEEVLRNVVFLNAAAERSSHDLSILYTVTDGITDAASIGLSVHVANAPYVDTQLDNVLLYEEGRKAQVIDTGLSVRYEGQLTGATVTFVGGLEADEDRLVFGNQNGISGTYRPLAGVLELTGTATVAQYESAIESIKYYNTRYNPSAGQRIIEYQVSNGTTVSNTIQALINVEPDLLSPVITLGSGGKVFQEDGQAVKIAPNFDLTAMDATDTFASAPSVLHGVEIAIQNYIEGEDTLNFTDTATINGEWNSDEGILFLYGDASFADYEAAVRSISYSNTSDAPSTEARQIRISLLDNGANGMSRDALTTQVVRSTRDKPIKNGGDITPVYVVQNGESTNLGLGDLRYLAPKGFTESDIRVVVRVTAVPSELLGTITTLAGDVVAVGNQLPLSELASLQFEPALGGRGTGYFKFDVQLGDPDSGRLDEAFVPESVGIIITGVATTTPSEAFIAQVFRDLTGRDPKVEFVQNWASLLDRKLQTAAGRPADVDAARATFVDGFTRSRAVRTTQVQRTYALLVNRQPTSAELSSAIASFNNGSTLDDLKLNIAVSDEYFMASDGNVSAYVASLFQDLRGEAGTVADTDRWVAALNRSQSRRSVAAGIADVEDAIERQANDLFVRMLDREITFGDDQSFRLDSVDSLTRQILSSDEYFGRNSVPTNARLVRTQPTKAYSSVGKLGDAGGDKAGGTLFAPQYVLVAAHSVADLPPGQLTFTVGGTVYHVSNVYLHPRFEITSVGTDSANDIAILKLSQPVTGVTPAELYSLSVTEGDVLNLVGFGEDKGAKYGTKRTGSTPAVDNVESSTFSWTMHSAFENDSDPGDSGSPLFIRKNGIEYVAGIVSGGTNVENGFGDTSVNTRVDAYMSWITSITGVTGPSVVSVSAKNADHTEGNSGNSVFTFSVTRSGRTDISTSVNWAVVVKGTHAADTNDFGGTLPSGVVTFAAGETSKTITVNVKGDTNTEPNELFFVPIWNPANGALIGQQFATGTIRNDDAVTDLVYAADGNQIVNVQVLSTGQLQVTIGGEIQPAVNPADVRSLTINGGTRNDTMNLTGMKSSQYVNLKNIVLNGNAGNDTITGSADFSEIISGGAGNDRLNGGAGGMDRLSETAPAGITTPFRLTLTDTSLRGSLGTDTISGFESGSLYGGNGNDTLNASRFTGRVILSGTGGNDKLTSGSGDDILFGGAGNDQLNGGAGDDVLDGGDGNDTINGSTGQNILIGGYGTDTLNGGSGQDLLIGGKLTGDAGLYAGLTRLMAEWASRKTITVRRTGLKSGGGLNGSLKLNSSSISNDGVKDVLTGGSGRDWFIQSEGDMLFDNNSLLGDVLDVL